MREASRLLQEAIRVVQASGAEVIFLAVLGRALGDFIFSRFGLKRILFTSGTFYIFPFWTEEDLIYLYFQKLKSTT